MFFLLIYFIKIYNLYFLFLYIIAKVNIHYKRKKNPFRKNCQTKNPPDSDPDFSLSVFYLSQNNNLDRTQVQLTYEVLNITDI
jgi:hypothetical protein